ncbi:Lrp/AsnC family transcriptional regulator [Gellertiella hungarica]|uniref:Lrp/AsnC family leucine-responsive transcriptional regulator n=1 Tax=Gellertiella hungarica TaxID=1572859 RepID=A0A7W6J7K0_9HYPH|nr:Lrp/AsnC family transcriptional regulator [Gellertiella hungarica]MBB4066192.1 Lrp/AsnC family leucine-responsive transcriptional regulator [Gellertiella hungarica]
MDDKDLQLLKALQTNARLTSIELADKIHLSPSPVQRRQKQLEKDGVIQSYVTLLDQEKLGLKVSVFVSVQLVSQDDENISSFERDIATIPQVMECYLMTGDYDYLLRVVTRDLNEFEELLRSRLIKMKQVKSIRSSSALRRVVYKTALPIG